MSEDRLQRFETILGALADEVGSLTSDMKTLRGEITTKQDLAALRTEMATKENVPGVAKNVDVTALGSHMRKLLAIKDDVRVLTAIMQRLDNTVARQSAELTEVRAEHSRMDRLLNRVRTLETAQPPDGIR